MDEVLAALSYNWNTLLLTQGTQHEFRTTLGVTAGLKHISFKVINYGELRLIHMFSCAQPFPLDDQTNSNATLSAASNSSHTDIQFNLDLVRWLHFFNDQYHISWYLVQPLCHMIRWLTQYRYDSRWYSALPLISISLHFEGSRDLRLLAQPAPLLCQTRIRSTRQRGPSLLPGNNRRWMSWLPAWGGTPEPCWRWR